MSIDSSADDQALDALFEELAVQERRVPPPAVLADSIMAAVQPSAQARRAAPLASWPALLEQWLQALRRHWLRSSLLGASAAAVPLALGLLLAVSVEGTAPPAALDPTALWLNDLDTLALDGAEAAPGSSAP